MKALMMWSMMVVVVVMVLLVIMARVLTLGTINQSINDINKTDAKKIIQRTVDEVTEESCLMSRHCQAKPISLLRTYWISMLDDADAGCCWASKLTHNTTQQLHQEPLDIVSNKLQQCDFFFFGPHISLDLRKI
jgi:hypothetical protein